MALDGQTEGVQHSFGGVEVRDDPLRDRDRMRGHSEGLRIQTEIDDQFLRRAGAVTCLVILFVQLYSEVANSVKLYTESTLLKSEYV